jgi:UDP-glucose 4-epimerase
MQILMMGGAGYIGSHMVKHLGQLGCAVTTLDNLSSGHRDAVLCGDFVHGDLADRALLANVLQPGRFDAVMHFASFIQVGESVQHPAKYYANNVTNTLNLLDAMRAAAPAFDVPLLSTSVAGAWRLLRRLGHAPTPALLAASPALAAWRE